MDKNKLGRGSGRGRGLYGEDLGKPLRSSGLRGLSSREWSEVDHADGERVCKWDHELNFVVRMKYFHLPLKSDFEDGNVFRLSERRAPESDVFPLFS